MRDPKKWSNEAKKPRDETVVAEEPSDETGSNSVVAEEPSDETGSNSVVVEEPSDETGS